MVTASTPLAGLSARKLYLVAQSSAPQLRVVLGIAYQLSIALTEVLAEERGNLLVCEIYVSSLCL